MKETLPVGCDATEAGFDRVAQDTEGVGEEELGDVVFVVGEVVAIGVAEWDVGVFKFDKNEG